VLGLYPGQPRARAFRRHLSERAVKDGAGIEVLLEALEIAESQHALMAAAE
jgi:tRNA-dihydrouridine synthase A